MNENGKAGINNTATRRFFACYLLNSMDPAHKGIYILHILAARDPFSLPLQKSRPSPTPERENFRAADGSIILSVISCNILESIFHVPLSCIS